MRILADTNIVVSAILFPNSVVARVWSYIIEYHHVVISKYSIDELKAVFQRKFPYSSLTSRS
jgi:predicted nucleic acid-binding protein